MPHSIDQLKQAAEAKAQERHQLEQLRLQRLRALQQLDKQIDTLRMEESLLQSEIRHQHQANIQRALAEVNILSMLV